MESALTMTPPSRSASVSASADLPLVVGPAIRMASGRLMARARPGLALKSTGAARRTAPRKIEAAAPADYTSAFGRPPWSDPLSLIRPFRALRPGEGHAGAIIAPPYDVLSSAEARERA